VKHSSIYNDLLQKNKKTNIPFILKIIFIISKIATSKTYYSEPPATPTSLAKNVSVKHPKMQSHWHNHSLLCVFEYIP